ncbi:hypothetical protein PISMIDRAFT_17139 [Pisolithus microcarpus 441]|uniref:Uncharacterized protein n=1 Tax=Pisolithus microcarpus 441 TaxID=765257 RepID=A0A0C9YLE3_9AGAM|nr:hypothetical protein PISMIDRAFT_17139 [Pisolithus microcarpus 441]
MPEDFTLAINAVARDSLDDSTDNDEEVLHGVNRQVDARDVETNLDRELDEVRRVMADPTPDASAADLRQALEELIKTRNELSEFKAKVAPRARSRALKSIAEGPLDAAIVTLAKNFDLCSPTCYQTPESKATANGAELYLMLPSELRAQATKYEHFEQLFTSTVNNERGNILKPVKDSATQLFTHLNPGLDPVALGDWRKRTANVAFLSLLKRNPENTDEVYSPLAPILFQDPSVMDVSGLFKNKVLIQIACVLHFGKGVLTGKKKGGPPGRGQKLKATTMTEGVIAICCTLARFLLSGDDEFSSTGGQTGISYEKDFEFYIELLRKQENKRWALGIFEHFDSAVFGASRRDGSQQPPSEAEGSVEQPRSWEDDLLAQLGGLSGTEGVNSNTLTVPFAVPPIAHPSNVTSNPQSAADPPSRAQMHTNPLSITGATWGGASVSSAMLPTTSFGVSIPVFTPHLGGTSMAETGTSSQVGLSVSMSPSQSVIVSTTGADLHLPLSDLSLGSSLSSVSSHLNPPAPPVVIPALVTAPPSKATKKGKRAQAKTTEGGVGVAPARATRSTNRQKKP